MRENLSSEVWHAASGLLDDDLPVDFFEDIALARDGGLSEVKELWSPARYISGFLVALLTLSNVGSLLYNDIPSLQRGHPESRGLVWTPTNATEGDFTPVTHTHYLVSRHIAEVLGNGITARYGWTFRFDSSEIVVCTMELCLLCLLILKALYFLVRSHIVRHEDTKWLSLKASVWEALPELATFSAMRLLHFITPSVLSADLFKYIAYSGTRWHIKGTCQVVIAMKWLKFVVTRSFCFVVGFDSFLVKVRTMQKHIDAEQNAALKLVDLWVILSFLIQVLGIVQLGMFVKRRLTLFVFGGEDSILQVTERVMLDVWEGMLLKTMFMQLTRCQAIALMFSFCDEDFQKLVFNEWAIPNDDEETGASGSSSEDTGSKTLSE